MSTETTTVTISDPVPGEAAVESTTVTVTADTGPRGPSGDASGGIADGDKGDIVVSGSGTAWTIDAGAVDATKVAADVATQAELDAEAVLARNADNLTSGTVADARIPSTVTRDADLGTAAALDIPATGDAAIGEVVKGDDSRLTDDRTPTAHNHTLSDVTDSGALAAKDTAATADIDDNAVTLAKLADIATASILGRTTAATGDPEVLTAAQVRTLLNVEDGATADQTAAEILAALLTVDGPGSLLDADLLDGNEATAFATSGHDHSGTYHEIGGTDVPVADGGTGASTAAGARTNLDVDQAGDNVPKTAVPVALQYKISDEDTAITAGTAKLTVRAPHAFTLTGVRVALNSACATGTFTVDVNEGGTSVLSTKVTVDATETTSTTAVTAAVISDSAIADDAELTFDVDDAGDGTATGALVTLIGTRDVS